MPELQMRSIPHLDQFSGCLIGQCLGDALGFPVEGSPPDICASYVKQLRTLTVEQTLPTRRNYASGQYTDDSQLARELMVSYAELGWFDPSDYAQRIRSIFSENRIVGRGLATDAAGRRLMAGVPWEECGTPSPQAGNGTAMRAGPVGMLFGDDPEQMIQVAHIQGRVTHKDPRCSDTDGIAEAMDAESHEFGIERLLQVVAQHACGSAADLQAAILKALEEFAGGAQQADDITLLILRYRGQTLGQELHQPDGGA